MSQKDNIGGLNETFMYDGMHKTCLWIKFLVEKTARNFLRRIELGWKLNKTAFF